MLHVHRKAAYSAGLYLVVATAWIVGSDALVASLAGSDPLALQKWQTAKGVGFVVAMATGIYLLTAWTLKRQRSQAEEIRRMEEMLQVSQRLEALGTLAATVVHDFNNVIAVIRGSTDLARLQGYDSQKMPRRLATIEQSIEKANAIVQQLSHFMRHTLQVRLPGDLGDVVRRFEGMLRQAVGSRVQMSVEIPPALRPVELDRGQVEQILLNLAVNARDAMEGSPRRVLRFVIENRRLNSHRSAFQTVPVEGDYAVLSVSDSGCGIAADDLVRVFSPFSPRSPKGVAPVWVSPPSCA